MDYHLENYFFHYNKLVDEKLEECIHNIERQIDRLYNKRTNFHYYGTFDDNRSNDITGKNIGPRCPNPYSTVTYSQFGYPYIKDFRNFSPPTNNDVKQIQELTASENVDNLIKNKAWTKESKQQLVEAVQDFYATAHTVRLIKQEEILIKKAKETHENYMILGTDCAQNLKLIEEQKEQVKSRKDPRIFVPEDRLDPGVDWCQISAKLSKTLHDVQDCRLLWQNQLHWTINNNLWSKEEDECLLKAVEKHGKNDWDTVSRELNSNRLPWQCCARFQQEFGKSGQLAINQDDLKKVFDVINLCKIGNYVPWNQVMYFVKFYSLSQVKYQWNKLMSNQATSRPWSNEEDSMLLDCIEKFGVKDWSRIASCIPGRSNRSCRERYVMRLKFDRRCIGKWHPREDIKLLACVERFGTNWVSVSSNFSNRNEHQIRNRYEILKNNPGIMRRGGIKRRKVIRNNDGLCIEARPIVKRSRKELDIDQRFKDVFSSNLNIQTPQKSLVCRSGLDDLIYQNLHHMLELSLCNRNPNKPNMLYNIINKGLQANVFHESDILTPNYTTLQGYKAWYMQQEYLTELIDNDVNIDEFISSDKYIQLKKIVRTFFLWPALMSKLTPKELEADCSLNKSIIEKDSKNLFKIREIQKNLGSLNSII